MESKSEDLIQFRVNIRIRPLSDKEKSLRAEKILRIEDNIVSFT